MNSKLHTSLDQIQMLVDYPLLLTPVLLLGYPHQHLNINGLILIINDFDYINLTLFQSVYLLH